MRIRTLIAVSCFALSLAAAPALAGSDSDSSGSKASSGSSGYGGYGDYGGSDQSRGPVGAVPEPGALLVFALGAAGVAWTVRRRKNG